MQRKKNGPRSGWVSMTKRAARWISGGVLICLACVVVLVGEQQIIEGGNASGEVRYG